MIERSPKSLFPPYAATVANVLRTAVATFGDEEFLIGRGGRLTFREADNISGALARGLLSLGVGKGSRVGLLMSNSADWILCWLAAARIGALTVPISTLYQGPELLRVLNLVDVQVLLTVDRYMKHDYVDRLEEHCGLRGQDSPDLAIGALPYLRRVVVWGHETPPWALPGPDHLLELSHEGGVPFLVTEAEARVTPADDLVVVCTSGSTAEPKAVVHTNGSVVRLCHSLLALGWSDVRPGDRIYAAVPFFWIGGLNSTILPALFKGASVLTTETPDLDEVVDTCVREGVTGINAWTPQLQAIEDRVATRGEALPHYRSRLIETDPAGDVIPASLVPNPLGMTETFGPHGAAPGAPAFPWTKRALVGPLCRGSIAKSWIRRPERSVGPTNRASSTSGGSP